MENNIDKITSLVAKKLVDISLRLNLQEGIKNIIILRCKLSTLPVLGTLADHLKIKGSQWQDVKIVYKDVPARVECNSCGTRFSAHADWSPCPDCGNPGAFYIPSPYQLKLKEFQLEDGQVVKAKRDTILLL
jgi:Zn finger protein HypA/HybF involved in hydrogenase expression